MSQRHSARLGRPAWALLLAAAILAAAAPAAAGEGDEAAIREQLVRGFELLQEHRGDEAIRLFKKADRLAGGGSAEALVGLATAYNQVGAYASGEKTAVRACDLATDPRLKGQAISALAVAVYYRAGDDRARLEEAVALFRSVLELDDEQPVAKYNLGAALLKLGRDDEGLDLLEEYLATDPTGPNAADARALVDDPRRARENLVPDFSVITLDGEYLTPADLKGKVVLVDFWATWCGPCQAAAPYLRRLHRKAQGKPFSILSISIDAERDVLEAFIRDHDMTWTQAWDERSTAASAFRIRSYPTYLLVDPDGRVLLRLSGWSDRIRGVLDSQIRRTIRDLDEEPAPSP